MPTRAARALLQGVVDYAGLFPPAGLCMTEAVQSYASHAEGPHGWMLGRFVVPTARLGEFDDLRSRVDPDGRFVWRLAALAGADPSHDALAAADYNRRNAGRPRGRAIVETIEFKPTHPLQVAEVAARCPPDVRVASELPLGADLAPWVAAVRESRGIAKARLGGQTVEAIPGVAPVRCWLTTCAEAGVPVKATAGLHHAVRSEHRLTYAPDSPTGTMHGFLNLLMGACLAFDRSHAVESLRLGVLDAVLLETDPVAFRAGDAEIVWREVRLASGLLDALRREFALSFGSCAFEEPVHDLEAMGWL